MNITILSNRDLASCVALNHLLPQLGGHSLRVFLSSRVGQGAAGRERAAVPEGLDTLKFIEQDLFNDHLFPLMDRAASGGAGADSDSQAAPPGTLLSFRALERYLAAPIELLNDINGEGLARFAKSAPDIALSIRYGVILREDAIAVPRCGVLNLHSGRLPDYKGVMATFRALMNGDSELNMTLHTIDDSGIDTGRILAYSSLAVARERSYLWHVLKLYEGGCRVFAEAALAALSGEAINGVEQASLTERGRYFSFPTQEELLAFSAAGFRLVDSADINESLRLFTGGGSDGSE